MIGDSVTHDRTKRSAFTWLERLDAFLNERIGDALTDEQIRWWRVKRDIKRHLQSIDDTEVDAAAARALRAFSQEAA